MENKDNKVSIEPSMKSESFLYVVDNTENAIEHVVLGVDVGGSHVTAGLIDIKERTLIRASLVRKSVNSNGSYDEIMSVWNQVLTDVSKQYDLTPKIGIAMPGPFEYEKGISLIKGFNKYDSLYQRNIKDGLANMLNTKPDHIRMKNDAACFLQGELYCGAAKGVDNVLGLTLGTGFGSALGINGIVRDVELSSKWFLNGIAEEYFSTKWFLEEYYRLSGKSIGGVKEMSQLADDPFVKSVFKRFCKNLSIFLQEVLSENNITLIVIGGNISNCETIISELRTQLKNMPINVPICQAILGEEAALIGAASLWDNATA
jgi:glucokinase